MDDVIRKKPGDVRWPTDKDWCEAALAALDDPEHPEHTRRWIVSQVDISEPTLSDLLNGEQQSSWAVPHISRLLKIATPQQKIGPVEKEILTAAASLGASRARDLLSKANELRNSDADAYDLLIANLEAFIRKNK